MSRRVRLPLHLCREPAAVALEAAAQVARTLRAGLELLLLVEEDLLRLARLPLAAELPWPEGEARPLPSEALARLAAARERALREAAAGLRTEGLAVDLLRLEGGWSAVARGLAGGDLLLLHRAVLPVPASRALTEAAAASAAPVLLLREGPLGPLLAALPAVLAEGVAEGGLRVRRGRLPPGAAPPWAETPLVLLP